MDEKQFYPKEKEIIVTTISLLLVVIAYSWYVYARYILPAPELLENFQFLSKAFLIMIPVMIVALIILHIIFAIFNKIFTNEEMAGMSDERDKLIELKALRLSHWTWSAGFLIAIGTQAAGMKEWWLLVTLISFCFIGAIVEGIAKIYFYRKGV